METKKEIIKYHVPFFIGCEYYAKRSNSKTPAILLKFNSDGKAVLHGYENIYTDKKTLFTEHARNLKFCQSDENLRRQKNITEESVIYKLLSDPIPSQIIPKKMDKKWIKKWKTPKEENLQEYYKKTPFSSFKNKRYKKKK